MPTAHDIKSKLQQQERDRTKRRTDAVMAVVAAGTRAIKGQDAAKQRKETLRVQYERALAAEDAKLAQLEAAAGEAVLAATGGELEQLGCGFRETELRELTGLPVGDFRRWVRAARQAGNGDANGTPSAGDAESGGSAGAVDGAA